MPFSRPARTLVFLAVLAPGCGAASDSGGETDGGSTGDVAPPPPPDFTEPASGRIDVPISRVEDIVLGVTGTVPGHTRLVIDGATRGTLTDADPLGSLTADALVLRTRGAMVPSVHTMQLLNSGGEEPLVSSSVEAHLVPLDAPPVLVVEPDAGTRTGHAVLATGSGEHGLLVILDETDPAKPSIVVAPRSDDGWDFEAARRLALPGHRRAPGEAGLAIAADRTGPATDETTDRLRVAWRVGLPGEAIDVLDVAWNEADETAIGTRAFDLDPAVLGPYEHAELRRPAILGDTLVAEALAATDVEAPRPGDRTLLAARLSGVPATVVGAARLVLGDRLDVDAIGPVLDAASVEVGGPPLLSVRLDGRSPAVLAADPVHGRLELRPTLDDGRSRALSGVTGPLSTVLGAFGSRRVAGRIPGQSARIRLVEIDDFGTGDVAEHSLGPDTLPDPDAATGELAVATIAGLPVWLVPFGEDVPVHAVITGTPEPAVQPLDELRCVQVAVAFDPRDAGAALHVACASGGGQVTTARVRLAPG